MPRALPLSAIFLAAALHAQSAATPSFEVAAIHPTPPDSKIMWMGTQLTPSGRMLTSKVSLSYLVYTAYGDNQEHSREPLKVVLDHGAPKWIDDQQFDIDAKLDDNFVKGWDNLSYFQRLKLAQPMIQNLLTDRFHLKFHTEMRPTPVYALVQGKGGAHIKEVPAPPAADLELGDRMGEWMRDHPSTPAPGSISCGMDNMCHASAVRMSWAVSQIAANAGIDTIAIDDTGLNGYYELSIPFGSDGHPAMREIEQQLNVRFEPRTIPIKTYVIESADKPSVD